MGTRRVTLSKNDLRKLQLIELDMLIELDRICRKYNIEYRIDGGTLLGAIRHKGFIPWDDDIDITMTRSSYTKFCKICETELSDKYFLQTWDSDRHYRKAFGRMVVKHTKFVPLYHEKDRCLQGISMDIFPYDYIPDSPKEFKRIKKRDVLLQRIIYAPSIIRRPDKLYRKIYFGVLSLIPMKLVKSYHACVIKKINQKKSTITKCFGFTGYRDIYGFDSSSFDERIELEFEGRMFFAPKGYDIFLKRLYGDYMQLPPVEKRRPNTNIVQLDFGPYGSEK